MEASPELIVLSFEEGAEKKYGRKQNFSNIERKL